MAMMQLSGRATALRRPVASSSSDAIAIAAPAAAARRPRSALAASASSSSSDAAAAATTTTTSTSTTTYTRATLRTTDASELAVSVYPFFRYKAGGGGGDATVVAAANTTTADALSSSSSSLIHLSFDPSSLRIPALDYRTAYLFGVLPIPPPLRIAIEPRELRGTLDLATGACDLTFDAEFCFSAGALYKAPALRVQTVLTTGTSTGARLSGEGRKWDRSNSSVRLAGVARVPKTGDAFLDAFLMLPNDALAVLEGGLELR